MISRAKTKRFVFDGERSGLGLFLTHCNDNAQITDYAICRGLI
jgi:hypothetical protein